MELLGAVATHVGNVRENNQDRAHFGGYVAVVADGMGGHQGGETAAAIAVSDFQRVTSPIGPSGLVELVEDANRAVFERAADPDLRGMGTTLVALTLRPGESKVSIVNVGDSRAYFLRGSDLAQVTYDHSLVEDLVRQKRLTPEEALNHPQRNILTRALGISSHVEVDQFLLPTKVGDRFLLCSDGLFNEVSGDDILRLLQEHRAPAEAADALVAAALSGAGRDNITVAVIDVVDDGHGGAVIQPMKFTELAHDPAVLSDPDITPAQGIAGLDPTSGNGTSPALGGAQGGGVLLDVSAPAALRASTLHPAPSHRGGADPSPAPEALQGAVPAVSPDHQPVVDPMVLAPEPPRRRVVFGLVALGMVLGALVAGGYMAARWYNASTWYVEAAKSGQVAIFQGRPGGFLWNDPVLQAETGPRVDELTSEDKAKVDQQPTFGSRQAAEDFVGKLMSTKALAPAADALDDIATSTTTTATTATTTPITSVPDPAQPNVPTTVGN